MELEVSIRRRFCTVQTYPDASRYVQLLGNRRCLDTSGDRNPNRTQEVIGSIPFSSTKQINNLDVALLARKSASGL